MFLIGGFSDLFKDAVFTMVQHLKCPVRALIGPWSHSWPTDSSPGPRIDHLKECLRWFDYQLKGLPTGIMDEPVLRLFLRDGMFCNCVHIFPSSFIITEVVPGDFRVGGSGLSILLLFVRLVIKIIWKLQGVNLLTFRNSCICPLL